MKDTDRVKRWNSEVRPLLLLAAQRMDWCGEAGWAAIIRKTLEEWTATISGDTEDNADAKK